MQYRVISADNHVVEPPGTFVDRVPASLRDRVPRVLPGVDGGEGWSWDGQPPATTFARDTMGTGGRGLGWDAIPQGQWEGAAHLQDMASDGVDAAVLYPGIGGRLYAYPDREAALACFRAYNDWLIDDFCGVDPSRLIAMPMLPTDDGFEAMMSEAEHVLARGARGVFLPYTSSRGLYDPFYDPLWKVLSAAGVVASLHNFGGTPPPPPAGVPPTNLRASTTVGSFFSAPGPLTHMMFAGVFERFPDLKFVAAEVNVGWVPYWLQQMHMTIERPFMKGGDWYPFLPTRTPEEYVGKNIFFTVLDDYLGFRMMKEDARLASATMWSIDYPHGVSLWGQNRELIDELTAGMDDQTRHAILAGTAVRLFNLT